MDADEGRQVDRDLDRLGGVVVQLQVGQREASDESPHDPRVQDVVEQPVAVDRDLVAGGTWCRHRRALRLAELLPLALVPLHWRPGRVI